LLRRIHQQENAVMLKKIIILFLLGGPQAVFAGSGYSYEDGRGLAGVCEGESNFDRGVCHSYLIAIHDAHGSLAYSGALGDKQFCTPEGVEVGVLKEAFLTYASNRPGDLHRTASSLVIDAYRIAFPCA
jgi:hypothetical protein